MAQPFIQGYKTPTGKQRYRAWYYDAVGRKVGKVFHTKREAEGFLRDRAGETAAGTLIDTRAGRVSLQSVWDERHAREPFAAATLKLHAEFWKVLGPILGSKPIAEIRPAQIDAALAEFKAPSMKTKARAALSAAFNYAIAEGRIAINPAKARQKSRTRAARIAAMKTSADDDQRYLSGEQLAALVLQVPDRYRALVELMAWVGLRPGEAYALTVGQFDARRRVLKIDRTVDGPTTKTGETRTVALPSVVAEMLTEHIERHSNPEDSAALVFATERGSGLDRNTFRHLFQRAAKRANVNHRLSPNHLRHTAVAFAIENGANVYHVQRMVGHAKPSITLDVYGHLWPDSSQRFAEDLDVAIRANRSKYGL
ncbi:MAG TPA: site-specific integrase [Actinomycetota bacterium]|nr:site-specific integrase [Actinomycetota bacterium]